MRAKQYKSGEFYEDGGRLFCRVCNVVITHQRKSTVDDHLKSASHIRHSQSPVPKKQKTIDTTLNTATAAAENRVAVCRDWVKMLVQQINRLAKVTTCRSLNFCTPQS